MVMERYGGEKPLIPIILIDPESSGSEVCPMDQTVRTSVLNCQSRKKRKNLSAEYSRHLLAGSRSAKKKTKKKGKYEALFRAHLPISGRHADL